MSADKAAAADKQVPDEEKAKLEGLAVQNGPSSTEGEAEKKGSALDREASRVDDLKKKGQ